MCGVYDLSTSKAAKTPLQRAWSSPKPGWIKGQPGVMRRCPGGAWGHDPQSVWLSRQHPVHSKRWGRRGGKSQDNRRAKLVNVGRLKAGTDAR